MSMKKYQVACYRLNVGFKRHNPSDRLYSYDELGAESHESLALYVQRGDLIEHNVRNGEVTSVFDLKQTVVEPPAPLATLPDGAVVEPSLMELTAPPAPPALTETASVAETADAPKKTKRSDA